MVQRPREGQGWKCTKRGGCAPPARSADLDAVSKASCYLALCLLSACSGMAMRAPSDVAAQSDVLFASDRQRWGVTKGRGSFSMGPYRIEDVERHPVRQSGLTVFGFGEAKLMTSYDFAFSDGARHREGHCDQVQDKPTSAYAGTLRCRCGDPGHDALEVQLGEDAKSGTLTLGGQSYKMAPLRERESGKQNDEPLGYRVDGATPLAAVELEGRVWTQRALGDGARADLVCMLSGLLLLRPVTTQKPLR